MVGWHHRLNGHEFEQTCEDCEGQRSHMCYSSWDHKESDMTEQLNNSDNLGYNRSITFNSDSSKVMSMLVRSANKHEYQINLILNISQFM